jgi:hypothetical protein
LSLTLTGGARAQMQARNERVTIVEVSPFLPLGQYIGSRRVRGGGGFPPIRDGQSLESAMSEGLVRCKAPRFEWRDFGDEPPDAVAVVEVRGSVDRLITCLSKFVRFDFFVRPLSQHASEQRTGS